MTNNTVSVVGLGKLGLPLVNCLSKVGYDAIGVDKSLRVVNAINNGICPIFEPGLESLLRNNFANNHIRATTDLYSAVLQSQIIFVIVPTPSRNDGSFDTIYINEVSVSIANIVKECTDYKIIDIVSTVLPGDTRKYVIKTIEDISGKICGKDFGVCYNPEFIALGDVIHGIVSPDFVMIGVSDDRSGNIMEKVYRRLTANNCPIRITSIENAELAKISLNVFVTMKIAYAITLAQVCEKISGCNVDEVTSLVGMDSRIGQKYLKAGLSYGGPCFPRDNRAFSSISKQFGILPLLSEATDTVNYNHEDWIYSRVMRIIGEIKNPTISVLGITYKTNTNIIEESAIVKLIKKLMSLGIKVNVYDPSKITIAVTARNSNRIVFCESIISCLKESDLAIVSTPWEEFKTLTPSVFNNTMRTPNLFDCWRIYDVDIFRKSGIEYNCVGVSDSIIKKEIL